MMSHAAAERGPIMGTASGSGSSSYSHHKDMPQSPRPTSPFTPPATGETKIGHGRRSRASSEEDTHGVLAIATTTAKRDSRKRQRTAHSSQHRGESVESIGSCSSEAGSSTSHHSSSSDTHDWLNEHVDGDYYATINDTPHNPFLRGAPSDLGFSGNDLARAHHRKMFVPPREIGKMTYVFRGQRVTYADPYASDSDSEDGSAHMLRMQQQRTKDRLTPRLLFPDAHATARKQEASAATRNVRATADARSSFPSSASSSSSLASSGFRGSNLFSSGSKTDASMSDNLEAPVAQPAKSPARGLLGLCEAAEHVQKQQQPQAVPRNQRQKDHQPQLGSTDAPWLHAELMVEQDRLRQQVNLNPLSRELLARMDGSNWTDDDGEDAMDHDAAHAAAPWYAKSSHASSGRLAQSLGFSQRRA